MEFVKNTMAILFVIIMGTLIYKMSTVENEYKVRGELYQCFIEGKHVYSSNARPKHRGNNWFIINGKPMKVDDCFCMGCIGF